MALELRRKTPEEALRDCQAEEAAATKGHLKIFLGYASGVGKSFRMLDEARRRRERGQDVVVGANQRQAPSEVADLLTKLEIIPLKRLNAGLTIDLAKLIARHPTVCFIDGLAYNNPPGARNPTRWRDVQDLLDVGIKVIASINIQYVAELQQEVEAITGKHVNETVPVCFIEGADEIEIVDAPPQDPMEYPPEEREEAQRREQRLSKLRELALTLTADVVDHQLSDYLERHGIRQQFGAHERILVCVTPRANTQEMIDTARIVAQRFHAELLVAYVRQPGLSAEDQPALDSRLAIASAAGAHIEILEGSDPAATILDFARSRGITQLYVGHSQRSGLSRFKGSPTDKLIWQGHGMDVHVFPQ